MSDMEKANDRRLATQVAGSGRIGALVLALWQRTRLDWGFVTDRLSTTFRHEKWLGSQERRFVAETVYGLVRHLRRIDAGLALGAQRRGASPRDRDRLIAFLVLSGALDLDAARRAEPGIDWARVRAIDEVIAHDKKRLARLAIGQSLPDWLASRLIDDWGDEAEAIARGLNERAPMTVRANRLKGTRDQIAAALAAENVATHPGAWGPDALIVDTRTNLFGLKAFKDGMLEAQDEGSQLLAELVDPFGTVVDLCAGAGGKTLAMAAAMKSRGTLIASDVDERKLEELRKRARRAGVSNTRAVAITAVGDWPPPLAAIVGKADRVLVDAPCSGVGSLRRNPEARWRLREDDVAACAVEQQTIVRRAADLLAPGGRLIYATCTLLRAENQAIVDGVLAARPELSVMPLATLWPERAAALGSSDGRFLQLRPDKHGTDGFFAAVLVRRKEA
jgi:16S rRNA (cytosine967-C5)-methyltransferase